MKKIFSNDSGINARALIAAAALAAVILFGCGAKKAPAGSGENTSEGAGLNLFTEILNFPDPDASRRTGGTGEQSSNEPVIFAEKFAQAYEDIIKKHGGSEPLEGPAKTKFSREMMVTQASILFDMRMGNSHAGRKKFLEITGWAFDERQPIDLKRQQLIDRGMKYFAEADAGFHKETSALLSRVKVKLKAVFTPEEYFKLTGEK
jgi:hypothetical protein